MEGSDKQRVLHEVKVATRDLSTLLDDYGDRLRRMRQRNRQIEEELVAFEEDLERLRTELLELPDDAA